MPLRQSQCIPQADPGGRVSPRFCLSGSSLAGLSITEIPLGYGIFCATYDFVVAAYLVTGDTPWHEPGKLDLYFWRLRL
jgi:hypothetical protein